MRYGIQIRKWRPNTLEILTELGVDFVQIPFHITKPPLEKLVEIHESGIEVYGKLIPDYRSWQNYRDSWREIIKQYSPVLSLLDVFGEPETRPGTAGCRWAGTAEELKEAVGTIHAWLIETKKIPLTGCGWAVAVHNPFFGNDDRTIFLDDFLKAGGGRFLDIITLNSWVHGYGGRRNILASVLYARYLLAKHGEPEKKIAIAETGASWEKTPPQFLHTVQTPEEQANLLIKNMVIIASMGCEYVCWFCLDYQGWGLLNGGIKTQAFVAFKEMTQMLKGSEYITQVKVFTRAKELSDLIEWHIFKQFDGQFLSIVWSEAPKVSLNFSKDFEYPTFIDQTKTIEINERPEYIPHTWLRIKEYQKRETF